MSIKVHRGRQLREDDAKEAHMIIGMDGTNVRAVRHQCRLGVGSTPDRLSGQHTHERTTAGIHVLRQWDPRGGGGVPDPFGRGSAAYEEVFTIVNRSCISLLRFLRRRNDLF